MTALFALVGALLTAIGGGFFIYGMTTTSFAHTGGGPDNLHFAAFGFLIGCPGVGFLFVAIVMFFVSVVQKSGQTKVRRVQ
jgi:hypothetical protein